MKNLLCLVLCLCLFGLSGCAKYPSHAADGETWDKSWTMLGSVLGVEEPEAPFTLLDNNSVLSGDDLYYAAWTAGEPAAYTNAEGKEVDLYDAQLYLLLFGCADEAFAQQTMEDWLAREQETYIVEDVRTETRNGQQYTLLFYTCGSDSNPYDRGVAAFTVCGNYALSAELACRDTYTGDEEGVLLDFLDGCHYSEELK